MPPRRAGVYRGRLDCGNRRPCAARRPMHDSELAAEAAAGPIAGIMIVDYWVLRRGELDVPDLYRTAGRYAGVNRSAVITLMLGVVPNVPGFLKVTHVVELSHPSSMRSIRTRGSWGSPLRLRPTTPWRRRGERAAYTGSVPSPRASRRRGH